MLEYNPISQAYLKTTERNYLGPNIKRDIAWKVSDPVEGCESVIQLDCSMFVLFTVLNTNYNILDPECLNEVIRLLNAHLIGQSNNE